MLLQVNYYAMQNIEANFPEPHRFLPERWLGQARTAASLDASTDGLVEGDPLARAFLPYSAGPRSCIGQPLAQMEVCLFVLHFYPPQEIPTDMVPILLELQTTLIEEFVQMFWHQVGSLQSRYRALDNPSAFNVCIVG